MAAGGTSLQEAHSNLLPRSLLLHVSAIAQTSSCSSLLYPWLHLVLLPPACFTPAAGSRGVLEWQVLAELQDRLPAFPTEAALAVIQAELGVDSAFDAFSELAAEPVAAASLGQVRWACVCVRACSMSRAPWLLESSPPLCP